MTEQQRLTIRAELARRMGWTQEEAVATEQWAVSELSFSLKSSWRSPFGIRGYAQPPNPFTNAADKDALVEWLADQSAEVWANFSGLLIDAAIPVEHQEYANWEMVTRAVMTSSLETITLAAAKALGIGEAE